MVQNINRVVSIIIATGLVLLSLVCLAIVLLSGLRSHIGRLDQRSFAVIDSSKVEIHVQGHKYQGLPDSNDFSKYKDFYAFYLWNYCSGVVNNGIHTVNFCSKPRQSLYDLFSFWKIWGLAIHKTGTRFFWLEKGPKFLYISYLVAGSIKAVELMASIRSLFTHKVTRITVAISVAGTISVLTTASLAQVTYGLLIGRADDDDISITARKVGQMPYIANWVSVASSIIAGCLWSYALVYDQVFSQIRRAPTLGTYMPMDSTGDTVTSPVQTRLFKAPARRRTFGRWPLGGVPVVAETKELLKPEY